MGTPTAQETLRPSNPGPRSPRELQDSTPRPPTKDTALGCSELWVLGELGTGVASGLEVGLGRKTVSAKETHSNRSEKFLVPKTALAFSV